MAAEKVVILIYVLVYDLTLMAQGLHGPFRGQRLQAGAVVVDMVECHKSRFHGDGLPSCPPSGEKGWGNRRSTALILLSH